MDYKVTQKRFNSIKEIVNYLISKSEIQHEEYESVKLYGESSFVIDAMKYMVSNCDNITIASIDITLSEIDPVLKDLYVLSLTEENELYIQPAYNGEKLYANEAKFTLIQNSISSQIVKDISLNDLSSTVIVSIVL